jgi:hypothetical protein
MPRMEKHVDILGWLYIVSGGFWLALGLFAFVVFGVLAVNPPYYSDDPAMLALIGMIILTVCAIGAIPGILGGLGLRRRKNWARILIIILGFLNLPAIPLGTALGIYTLNVLLKEETAKLFFRREE